METYCLFATQYLPTMGGVENFTYHLAKQLVLNGNKVIVVTSEKDGLPETETDLNGFEIIRVPSWQLLNGRLPVVKPSRKAKHLCNSILERKVTKIIVNTRFYPLSLYAVRFAKKHYIPCVVIEHGSAHLSLGSKLADFLIRMYEHIVCRMVYFYCKSFYGVSKKCVEWLLHFGIRGKGVVYNAIDLNAVASIKKDEFPLTSLGIQSKARVVCYVGRLIPEKGVLQLQNGFCEVLKKHPNTYLVLAGDGPLYDEMKAARTPNTILCGRLGFDKVVSLFKQADIFCLPTVSEGFPTSVLEAAACGCYILTTVTSGGATELICSEEYGTLMPDNKAETIAQHIINVLDDERREQKAKNAKQRVEENFTWQKTAESLGNIEWYRRGN